MIQNMLYRSEIAGGARRLVLALTLLAAVTSGGCQSALPGALALGDDAKIAEQAKADGFPSPAEVGLAKPTAVP